MFRVLPEYTAMPGQLAPLARLLSPLTSRSSVTPSLIHIAHLPLQEDVLSVRFEIVILLLHVTSMPAFP